ncbi:amidohydrolase [Reyranella sp. CPCC 100927]|uniref:amidohydrolase family protein n=1 Tax=Reyranella sp. CPCC 100927 TaxID=2599616 RepID=UPI0011B673F6|nr:amidohydrolase family protein [Reyranella sp. CPCC 100927]TWT08667.1 amidohydrolase family protein [Reyranella sp. CPCC 100927]
MVRHVPVHPLATDAAPACAGPRPDMQPPSWPVPFGACDTHAHVIGDGYEYPFVAERSYTPPEATETAYLRMLDGLGMTRGVLVQVSVHGTDNHLMLEVLRSHRMRLRGIAVAAADVGESTLRDMHDAGVRGLRLNVSVGGGIGFDALEVLASRIAAMGWHLQLLTTPARLLDVAPRLAGLPVPVVIDHMASVGAADGVEHPAFKAMLDLVKGGRCWVKLSGAYRASAQARDWTDIDPLAQALLAAAPDRMLWGSDWPHVHFGRRMMRTGETLEILGRWAPDPTLRKRILVTNPATLYGF